MIFGFGKKTKRHVVQTTMVAVDSGARALVIDTVRRAQAEIESAPDDFHVASRGLATVARVLLDQRPHWTMAAAGGDVFDDEDEASAQVAETFADLSTRYQSADDTHLPGAAADGTSHEWRCVVMLTVAYVGEEPALEREIEGPGDVDGMLRAMVALHERDGLLAAQLHVAPAHPEDRLTDEQLLVAFPELTTI